MARNPYQLDPYFARGLSNLTTALIGDPETDFQVARTKYQDAQTNRLNTLLPHEENQLLADIARLNATAGAQGALAGKYGAETNKTNLESDALKARAAALAAIQDDPAMGALINSQFDIPDGAALDPATLGSLAYLSLAEGDANAITQALNNIGEGQDFNTARNTVLDPNKPIGERTIANALLGNAPNENSDPAFARDKLDATLRNNLDVQDLENEGATAVANIEATSREKIADKDNAAQTAWERYKADKQAESATKVQELKNTQSGAEAAAKLEAEIKWEEENNIIVEDGVMVFSPEAAAKYGITEKVNVGTEEKPIMMHRIDVSQNNRNGVPVTIEGTDQTIYLDQQYFDKFNVVNKGGKFFIPEGAVNPPSNKGGNPPKVGPNEVGGYGDLITELSSVRGGATLPESVKTELLDGATKAQQGNNNVGSGTVYIREQLEPILVYDGYTGDVYTYPVVINKVKELMADERIPAENKGQAAIDMLRVEFGYSRGNAELVYQYIASSPTNTPSSN